MDKNKIKTHISLNRQHMTDEAKELNLTNEEFTQSMMFTFVGFLITYVDPRSYDEMFKDIKRRALHHLKEEKGH